MNFSVCEDYKLEGRNELLPIARIQIRESKRFITYIAKIQIRDSKRVITNSKNINNVVKTSYYL